jgi:hypothetical protein
MCAAVGISAALAASPQVISTTGNDAMRLLWLHEPHPCKACGSIITLAYPTCATATCREAWRLQSIAAACRASRAQRKASRRCQDCKKLLAKSAGVRCKPCNVLRRDMARERERDAAYRAYQDKLALAHAQREIEKKDAQQIRARIEAQEQAYREAREAGERGWTNDDGEVQYEEV